jgi:hypothetical protein
MAMNPEPRQRGGDQVLKGKRTLMSNARVQPARLRNWEQMRNWLPRSAATHC